MGGAVPDLGSRKILQQAAGIKVATMVKWEALFPTPVMTSAIGRPFTDEEQRFFERHQGTPHPNVLNVRSEDTHVLDAPEMQELRAIVMDAVNQFGRKTISSRPQHEFYLTQSWLNYTRPGEAHHRHRHTNSLISGVLYVNAKKDSDGIVFYRNDANQILVTDEGLNWYNAPSWAFSVGTGDLVLFPSGMMHGVDQTQGQHIRVSLAFNAFLKGDIGSDRSLNRLEL